MHNHPLTAQVVVAFQTNMGSGTSWWRHNGPPLEWPVLKDLHLLSPVEPFTPQSLKLKPQP